MNVEKAAFVAAPHPEAQAALERLTALRPSVPPEEADVVVAQGGDGFTDYGTSAASRLPRTVAMRRR